MSDLISRSALIAAFDKTVLPREFRIVKTPEARMVVAAHGKLVKRLIDEAPAVDAVPVVHGRWYLLDECSNEGVYCSVCHKKVYRKDYANQNVKSNYCPNCGADMRERKEK